MRKWRRRIGLAVGGLAVAVVLAEGGARVVAPEHFLVHGPVDWVFDNADLLRGLITEDPELGWMPRTGTWAYDEWGVRPGPHAEEKTTGVTRVLFLGDSVTRRGTVTGPLADLWGTVDTEYVNGGVEAFNTVQEAAWFQRHCSHLDPDLVVLLFHPNDFSRTPLPVFDDEGRFLLLAQGDDPTRVWPWLFKRSALYRLGLVLGVGDSFARRLGNRDAVKRGLRDLRDAVESGGAEFRVGVLPLVSRWEDWGPVRRAGHAAAIQFMSDLGIDHIDLGRPLEALLDDGLPIGRLRERPHDPQHPSPELGRAMAESLAAAWGRPGG